MVTGLFMSGKKTSPIPLVGCHVAARVVDYTAKVSVYQHFVNAEAHAIEAVYIFPLDEKCAVCDFEANVGGRTIRGVAQEKEAALATYNTAIAQGDGAYLLEQDCGDVFQTAVGNLLPGQEVTIQITYVTELASVDAMPRLVVPTTIAPRYTPAPTGFQWPTFFYTPSAPAPLCNLAPRSGDAPYQLSLMVDVELSSGIAGVESPSHKISATPNDTGAQVWLTEQLVSMDKDFVLLATPVDAHNPSVVLEFNPESGTHAAMLSLLPTFSLHEQKCEFVFVVDRSGSMAGSNLRQATEALQLFLRSLPTDCYVNICSFGSRFSSLFNGSRKYCGRSLQSCTSHVAAMKADFGGTKLVEPLRSVLGARPIAGYSRQVFVLTDGAVSNTDAVVDLVRREVAGARVFALGVGSAVSHALVNGLARAGSGTADFAMPGENLQPKVIRQLRAAMQPSLHDVAVTWHGMDAHTLVQDVAPALPSGAPYIPPFAQTSSQGSFGSSVLFSTPPRRSTPSFNAQRRPGAGSTGSLVGHQAAAPQSTRVNVGRRPGSGMGGFHASPNMGNAQAMQAPFRVPPVFSGERMLVYCLVRSGALPSSVTITARSPDGPLTITAPVEVPTEGNLAHALAARQLIRDIEEHRSYLGPHTSEAQDRQEIVRLGTTFSLASRHTSFVAVEERADQNAFCGWNVPHQPQPRMVPTSRPVSHLNNKQQSAAMDRSRKRKASSRRAPSAAPSAAPLTDCLARGERLDDLMSMSEDLSVQSMTFSKQARQPESQGWFSSLFGGGGGGASAPVRESAPVCAASMVPAPSAPCAAAFSSGGPPPPYSMDDVIADSDEEDGANEFCAPPDTPSVVSIALKQHFDGSFTLDDALCALLGVRRADAVASSSADASVIATALVIFFFETVLPHHKEEWFLVHDKAMRWLEAAITSSTCATDARALVADVGRVCTATA